MATLGILQRHLRARREEQGQGVRLPGAAERGEGLRREREGPDGNVRDKGEGAFERLSMSLLLLLLFVTAAAAVVSHVFFAVVVDAAVVDSLVTAALRY